MEFLGASSWHVIRFSGGELASEAADLILALESAYDAAGDPPQAQVFVAQRLGDRYTFLMSPEISRMVPEVLIQFDAVPCATPRDFADYAPVPL